MKRLCSLRPYRLVDERCAKHAEKRAEHALLLNAQ